MGTALKVVSVRLQHLAATRERGTFEFSAEAVSARTLTAMFPE
jgi:hypothetical protein